MPLSVWLAWLLCSHNPVTQLWSLLPAFRVGSVPAGLLVDLPLHLPKYPKIAINKQTNKLFLNWSLMST